MCLSCEDTARQSCVMVPRWRFWRLFFVSCIFSEPRAARFRPAFEIRTKATPCRQASERLSYLHWLPVNYRMQFKIATLTYKTLATCQPSYLYNLVQVYHPSRALRSSTQQLLHVPYVYWFLSACVQLQLSCNMELHSYLHQKLFIFV